MDSASAATALRGGEPARIRCPGGVNRWHTIYFPPPGFHIIENGSMPADTPDKRHALERKVLNLITPETLTSSHYFWGIVRQFRLDDRALDDTIREGIIRTFD